MLKFKEIKKSIMQPQNRNTSPLLDSRQPQQPSQPLCFRNHHTETYNQYSPTPKTHPYTNHPLKYDTETKRMPNPFTTLEIKTDSKENNPKHLYNQPPTFTQLSSKKLQFALPKRKTNLIDPSPPEKSCNNSASKHDNISFANLLSSKKPSNNSKGKFCMDSERKNERQSSISKLKEKLFGMKRVISEKEKTITAVHTPKAFSTNRDMAHPCDFNYDEQDLVKISMARDSFPHELDMAPFF